MNTELWRFQIYNKNEECIQSFNKVMTEEEADNYAHDLLHEYKASFVWHDRVSMIEAVSK